jgi:Tfp pilus assembly protein PilE
MRVRTSPPRARDDAGETLVEIVLTVVIIGLTVTALISGLATVSSASQSHRDDVRSDAVVRNYAEATKAAVRTCTGKSKTYTVSYSPPKGFTVSVSPADSICPAVDSARTLTLQVTGPSGVRSSMQIAVRAP